MKQFHPRAFFHSLLTYPRFLGIIKPHLLSGHDGEAEALLATFSHCLEAKELKTPIGKRLLVIAPHPDDESIGIGGLLLAHAGKSEIHILNVFNGEGGGRLQEAPWTDEPEYKTRLTAARSEELRLVAERLKATSVVRMDLKDGISRPNLTDAAKLREAVDRIRPDVVLIPWFLDNQRDHRATNVLYSWACENLECMVLAFEVWRLCPFNAYFTIDDFLEEKKSLIRSYKTQNDSIDYAVYSENLAKTRGFPLSHGKHAIEAMLALPNKDYCSIVQSVYGKPGQLRAKGRQFRE